MARDRKLTKILQVYTVIESVESVKNLISPNIRCRVMFALLSLATACWRDQFRTKPVSTVASRFSVWTLSCRGRVTSVLGSVSLARVNCMWSALRDAGLLPAFNTLEKILGSDFTVWHAERLASIEESYEWRLRQTNKGQNQTCSVCLYPFLPKVKIFEFAWNWKTFPVFLFESLSDWVRS